jgi:hypothetical protein
MRLSRMAQAGMISWAAGGAVIDSTGCPHLVTEGVCEAGRSGAVRYAGDAWPSPERRPACGSAAAAAPTAASPAGRGGGGRAAGAGPTAEGDRGEQLDGVGVSCGAGCRVAGGGHRPVDLEGRGALAAAEVVARHGRRIAPPAPRALRPRRAEGTSQGTWTRRRGNRICGVDGSSARSGQPRDGFDAGRAPQPWRVPSPAATGRVGRRGAGGEASRLGG